MMLGRSKLAQLEYDDGVDVGESNGQFNDSYRWKLTVARDPSPVLTGNGDVVGETVDRIRSDDGITVKDSSQQKQGLSRNRANGTITFLPNEPEQENIADSGEMIPLRVSLTVDWGRLGGRGSVTLNTIKVRKATGSTASDE